jgi:flagellar protein FliJ
MSDTIFSILIDMAERERDQQTKRLADATTRLQAAKDQLVMLEKYRDDYDVRRAERAQQGTSTDGYKNFQTFMAKLNGAVNQQKRDVDMWQGRVDAIRSEQSNSMRKVRSFETLRDKRELEARSLAAKRQQKLDDEFASRAYMMRATNSPTTGEYTKH